MDWRHAFLTQARSDFALMDKLNRPDCEYCHRLHYLQMASEKLAKGMIAGFEGRQPELTHIVLVRMLQILKGRPEMRDRLGYPNHAAFKNRITSLLEIARKIESLAPSSAGLLQPNPEYPWHDRMTNRLMIPCEFDFPEFDPKRPQMAKLLQLLRTLLRFAY